ncbi:TonB system transport protein ExbD [Rhizobium sp. RU36D]|uniref:TonB system transport protein ExbD n=1 Tax=Rhizobium sp. RU36D TaxID=1907415 RepID=UPI0009D82EF2|nr:TonB system transport protein ExbD [Rhizobium sp. RU36D]SMD01704.1 outer membrane transport energization protein ExbD [Rhizobium sp. RU36D]
MAGGIRENHGDDDLAENHEINVTPFIDVMLVLLIIFMVAAPLSTVDINVDLPASSATPAKRPDEPVYVTLQADMSLALGNETVQREMLGQDLDALTQGNKDARIFLRADKAVDYGAFMEVMNLLRNAGYLKIALVGLETLPQPPAAAAPASEEAAPATGATP